MVKPRRSYALQTLGSRGKVRAVWDADALAKVLREADPDETLLAACRT
jgi:hypothetical protein